MNTPLDPKALNKLENAAQVAQQLQDNLGALECYEEIESKGWANAEHFIALGDCYLKARQRQDARRALVKAIDLDPEAATARRMLDRYFPGWEAQEAKRKKAEKLREEISPTAQAQPEASPGGLTIETVAADRVAPEPFAATPPPQPAPIVQQPAAPVQAAPQAPPNHPAPAQIIEAPPAQQPVPQPAAATGTDNYLPPINWQNVIGDAMTQAKATHKKR